MATPTLSIFTGGENLGTVFKEQNQINVKYLEANLPLTATTGRLSLRMTATRFIVIQGAHDGTGFSGATTEEKIQDFISTLENWFNNGANLVEQEQYTSSFGESYYVDVVDFTWNRSYQQPFRILYSLILVEK